MTEEFDLDFLKKKAEELKVVFANSKYKCFVYDNEKLIGVGRSVADGHDVLYGYI